MDSPGHVDFFGEVSTGIRLCDGCILLVDVVEGVCSQTKSALHQAWIERLKPVLVLNKIDRLFVERKMSSLDIYLHLQQILEQINAFLGQLFTCDVLGKCVPNSIDIEDKTDIRSLDDNVSTKQMYDWSSGLDDVDDSSVYFTPESGNVVFASAIDGWGFTIKDFSKFLAQKYSIKEEVLKKTLWGDFYLSSKEKKIMKGALSKARKPLFVTMVLDNLNSIYDTIAIKRDKLAIEKIVSSLGVRFTTRDLNHSDPKSQLQNLFTQWLPISKAVLKMICDFIPSPREINEERVETLMCANTQRFDSLPQRTQMLKKHFLKCSSDRESPLIICVSKMFAFEKKFLPHNKARPLTHEEIQMRRQQMTTTVADESQQTGSWGEANDQFGQKNNSEDDPNVFIAFARVFSGTVRSGDNVYVLGPKHNPNKLDATLSVSDMNQLANAKHIRKCRIDELYILMGKELESVDEVCAGNILGIGGLENIVIKSATLSSDIFCPPFIDLHLSTVPILRVALEPNNPSEMCKLVNGLKMLNQADPCVEVKIQETGEHIIVTTGEVHLQRCLSDLALFTGIQIHCSEPIVPFRETIVERPKIDMVNEVIAQQKGTTKPDTGSVVELLTANKKSRIRIIAKPLPPEVCKLLDKSTDLLKVITRAQRKSSDAKQTITDQALSAIEELRSRLKKAFIEAEWPEETVNKIWSLGPKYCGTNILLNSIPDYYHFDSCFADNRRDLALEGLTVSEELRTQYDNSFVSGFQLVTAAGPLCDEPLMGVCFIAQEWSIFCQEIDLSNDPFGPFSGQIMSTVKDCCRRAFQAQPQRLMAAMFSCTIQVDSDALGKLCFSLFRCLVT